MSDGTRPLVGVIMGSRSDWETMRHAAETLTRSACRYEARVVSAHRTPDLLFEYADGARARGLRGDHRRRRRRGPPARHAGGEDARCRCSACRCSPRRCSGIDSLLSIVQMPAGDPGRHARHRQCRRDQRRAARGRDPRRSAIPAIARGAAPLPRASRPRRCSHDPDPRALTHDASVGILGGGQLGRMLALAGHPLGMRAASSIPSPDACARRSRRR